MLSLRPYQEEIIRAIITAIKEGFKSILVISPTGSGKTIMFAYMAMRAIGKGKRVLILTHRREILQQTIAKLLSFAVQAGQILSGKKRTSHAVQVAMVGTLVNRLDEIETPDLIIIDEAHHAVSNTWKKIILYFGDVLRIGYTATAERFDGAGLIEIFDTIVMGPTPKQLIADGYLTSVKYYRGQNMQMKREKIKITAGDYDKKEQTAIMKKNVIVGSVVNEYLEKANGLTGVYFCVSIEHCEVMEAAFCAAGVNAKTVKGDMPQSDRENILGGLSAGTTQIVLSCDVISEGVDIAAVSVIGFLRLTKSLGLAIQQMGRGLRPVYTPGMPLNTRAERLVSIAASTKPYCIVLDHSGLIYEHGWLLADRDWSLEAKKRSKRGEQVPKPEISVCSKCSGVWPGVVNICPDCGHSIYEDREKAEGRKLPKEIEGLLREIMPDETEEYITAVTAQAVTMQQMSKGDKMKAMLSSVHRYGNSPRVRGLAKIAGYKSGWTYSAYSRIKGRS